MYPSRCSSCYQTSIFRPFRPIESALLFRICSHTCSSSAMSLIVTGKVMEAITVWLANDEDGDDYDVCEEVVPEIAAMFARNRWKLVYGGPALELMDVLGRDAAFRRVDVHGIIGEEPDEIPEFGIHEQAENVFDTGSLTWQLWCTSLTIRRAPGARLCRAEKRHELMQVELQRNASLQITSHPFPNDRRCTRIF
ncbi:hypothetical protein K461DRAFT_154921 [Myriangium duriaei CBS 260.36]|uniref:Uncharacterized protein n=1 Tax=Myriangium duriaei CBS 260.36 TaxID=1168546 RepID=A0A9P4IXX7_9PEZI|nr:hypothetical protein K461DRAFT_154921 [Myriangium duriaei CBS 260.36]